MDKKITTLGAACTACMACFNICAPGAITMKENQEGFMYPDIDPGKCTDCCLCDERCPEIRGEFFATNIELLQKGYYGWHTDDTTRKLSSSGGIFSVLAEKTLESGGVVFGAVHDLNEKKVVHTDSVQCEWTKMRKSKYVQSYIGHTYRDVRKFLNEGKKVLFVGTPCQISGLFSFLDKPYSDLITCDFICHGVPPMKLLNDHLAWIEKKLGAKAVSFNFRPKTNGWTKHYFMATMGNGKVYHTPVQFDPYFGSFSKSLLQRESCYQCNYKVRQHFADFTVADYWGYRRHDPKILDERGLSIMMVNTEKAEKFLAEINPGKIEFHPVKWENASYDYTKRTCRNINGRNLFYHDYIEKGYSFAVKKYHLAGTKKEKIRYYIYQPLVSIKKNILNILDGKG